MNHWYTRYGFHQTAAFGRVQRYKCRLCGKSFSEQTFLLNYWLKKPTDFASLGRQLNSCSSGLFVGRHFGYSADSLRIRCDRLARNALFFQATLSCQLQIREALVADGLESFVASKFFPLWLNVLVGSQSQFVYFFTESHGRRKGSMSEKQKQRCQCIYADKCFTTSSLSRMFTQLLGYLKGRCSLPTVQLHTDEHPVYQRLIKDFNNRPAPQPRIDHHQTTSTAARTTTNPLFAVNYFDRLIRKDLPNHRRQSICYARNDRNLLSRFAYYVVTHNFHKPFRISSVAAQSRSTHAAVALGACPSLSFWKPRLHTCRFFRSFVQLPAYYGKLWVRNTPTPLKRQADPVPAFATQ
jgi:hypothetical protein